jgi:LptD protein
LGNRLKLTQIIFGLVALLFTPAWCYAQSPAASAGDRKSTQADTARRAVTDSLKAPLPQGDISTTIVYSAKDSLRFDVIKRQVFLFGDAKISYGDIELQAARIEIDWASNTLKAFGVKDSTGKETGTPVFTDQGEKYESKVLTYNFKTRKGIISRINTKYGEGIIVGERVKKDAEDNMFLRNGIYTTCDLPDPHFGIRMKKMKIIPGKVVVSGLFNMEFNNVPTPLGFGFGMFPQPKKRSAGFLFPQYGETRERGFFLSEGGFYLPIGPYVDLRVTGEVFTRGGWGLAAQSSYIKKYAFTGNFSFRYNRRVNEVPGRLESNIVNDFNITWSHTPQSKGDGRFSASVNAGTNTFGRNNAPQVQNFQSSAFNSNISYNYNFTGTPFTAGVNLRHEQNVVSRIVSIFPEVNLGMNRIYPFKGKNSNSKSILSQLNLSYTARARGVITNRVQDVNFPFSTPQGERLPGDTLVFNGANLGQIMRNAQVGAQHQVPITTSVTLAKYFNISFNGNYSETWYPERFDFRQVGARAGTTPGDSTFLYQIDTIRGFSRFNSYSFGASMQTRLYAFFYPKIKSVEAMRLTINPNVGFNYNPDFGEEQFGFYQQIQRDNRPTSQVVRQSRFDGIYGRPQTGRSGAISFGLTNTLEMKLRSKEDTLDSSGKKKVDDKNKNKITLLDNISFNTAYNLAVDSFNLAPFALSARTNLFKKININLGGTLDPYYTENLGTGPTGQVQQRRTPDYAWQRGGGVGSFTNANMAITTQFAPPSANREKRSENATEAENDFVNRNRYMYVDFDVPWSLNLNYNLSYNRQGLNPATIVQTLSFNGDVKLTPKWKVGFNSGYDFQARDLSFTQLTIYRDLHCWDMNVSWIPFGPRAGYTLDINVRSSILRDLKLSRRNNWYFR